MALKIFTKERTNNHPPTQWLVNVNRKTGVFYLNNLIADDLGLEKGGKGLLASVLLKMNPIQRGDTSRA